MNDKEYKTAQRISYALAGVVVLYIVALVGWLL